MAARRPRRGRGSSSIRWMAPGPGRRWGATRTSSRRRPRRSPTRSNTRSGSRAPSCGVATSATSRPPRAAMGRRPRRRSGARPRPHGGDPMTDPDAERQDALQLLALDGDVGEQRAQPRRGRHRVGRPRVAGVGRGDRRDRRALPGGRPGARRGPDRPSAPARLRHPCARGGDRHDRRRRRPDRPAGHRRRAGERRVPRRGARAEHHRGLDRGVHPGAQRAARRGALVRRHRGRRQPQGRGRSRPARRASSEPTSTRPRRRTTRRPGSSADAPPLGRSAGR